MSLCFLGFHVRTAAVYPSFPLLYPDRFVTLFTQPSQALTYILSRFSFDKSFADSRQRKDILEEETVYIELLQVNISNTFDKDYFKFNNRKTRIENQTFWQLLSVLCLNSFAPHHVHQQRVILSLWRWTS